MGKMTIKQVLEQVTIIDGKVKSNTTGAIYEVKDFVDTISSKLGFNKTEKLELYSSLSDVLKPQSDASEHIEKIIKKYEFQFSDGVYIVRNEVITIDEIYRLMWKEEKLLPTEVENIVENIEKISETLELQTQIFERICAKRKLGKSKYLASLYDIYPETNWHDLFYNILVPKTKPLFHIFYDDGVGGTGKSTVLEVLTKIVGDNFTSNVLLDQFGNRFIFANMLGKYLNVGDDNGKNDELQNIGTLKSIITGNRTTIDRKNISPIEVRIFAKQLYATNLFPYIDFTDGGIMRRLNVVVMNRVITDRVLCVINDDEIGYIIDEVLSYGKDLEINNNDLAITSHPLYRFYSTQPEKTYEKYKYFCEDNGFRKLNIINFEVKSKFIKHYISLKGKKSIQIKLLEELSEDEKNELDF